MSRQSVALSPRVYDLQIGIVIPRNVLARSDFAICDFGLVNHPAEILSPQKDVNGSDRDEKKLTYTFANEYLAPVPPKHHNTSAKRFTRGE